MSDFLMLPSLLSLLTNICKEELFPPVDHFDYWEKQFLQRQETTFFLLLFVNFQSNRLLL